MSLFLKVQRFGAAPRLLRIRAFSTSVGFDQHGVLCSGPEVEPLFTVFNNQGSFSLRADLPGVRINAAPLELDTFHTISPGDVIGAGEFTLTTFITSASAEFFPSGATSGNRWGTLSFTLAGLQQTIPLCDGPFSVGSAPDDTLLLPLPGVLPRHLIGEVKGDVVTLAAPRGTVHLCEGVPLREHQITEATSVSIEPLGIVLHLQRMAPPKPVQCAVNS